MRVEVKGDNIEGAIRSLKRKLQREGLFREMRDREFFEKPSVKRAKAKAAAVRRLRRQIADRED